jgi:peptide/nickel transport system substrate-binding protein
MLQMYRKARLVAVGLFAVAVLATVAACGGGGGDDPAPTAKPDTPAASTKTADPTAVSSEEKKPSTAFRTLRLLGGSRGGVYDDVDNMNPFILGNEFRSGLHFVLPQLFYYNLVTGEEVPWAATSWSVNSNFTEYTVNIRDGVEWSDGEAFTAHDVQYTYHLLRDNSTLANWGRGGDVPRWVKQVDVIDDLKLTIVLNDPNPRFADPFLWSHQGKAPYIVPKHVWETMDDPTTDMNYDPAKGWPVATGPFELVENSAQQRIWDRRDDWWGAKTGFAELPAMDRIVYIPMTDQANNVAMMLTDQADATYSITGPQMENLLDQTDFITTYTGDKPPYGSLDWWVTSLYFNTEKPPFDNVDVRWAIANAINHDELVKVNAGAIIPSRQLFPQFGSLTPYIDDISDLLDEYDVTVYDLDKTNELMEKAGYTKNDGIWHNAAGEPFTILVEAGGGFSDVLAPIAEQLKRAGFDSNFKVGTDMGSRIVRGLPDAWLSGRPSATTHPWDSLEHYHSRNTPMVGEQAALGAAGRWKGGDTYDAIIDEMEVVPQNDTAEMTRLVREAYSIWLPELPDVPIKQWMQVVPFNTTHWTNWPHEVDNPMQGAYWPRHGWLMIKDLQPVD